MRQSKFVIVFDEFDRGSPKILEMLMSVLSDGKLNAFKTINGKRTFDFHECILLFTTNVPLAVDDPEGMPQMDITKALRAQLEQGVDGKPGLPKEITARFSDIVLYQPLSPEHKVDIMAMSIIDLASQFELTVQHISTELLQGVVDKLSVENGVREPKNAIDDIFGSAISNFAEDHDARDIILAGTHPTLANFCATGARKRYSMNINSIIRNYHHIPAGTIPEGTFEGGDFTIPCGTFHFLEEQ
jgi:ATP-dependent Clp protease ATP-binding subunit ClpA